MIVKGKLNSKMIGNHINGWLASDNINDKRCAVVVINNDIKFEEVADKKREDLAKKINNGQCGFIIEILEETLEKLPKVLNVSLYDKSSNILIDTISYSNPIYDQLYTIRKTIDTNVKDFIFPKDGNYDVIQSFLESDMRDRDDCKNIFDYHISQLTDLRAEKLRINNYVKSKVLKPKVVVFSSCTNSYDEIRCPKFLDKNFDYVLFSDSMEYEYGVWDIRKVPFWSADPTRISRYVKTHPHYLFNDYDIAIWVDTNICISGDFSEEISNFIKSGKPIAAFYHPLRKSVYDEANKCIELNKDDIDEIKQQVNRYKSLSFDNNDLIESNFMIFNLKHSKLSEIMNTWWSEIDKFSRRDQLSLNYAISKANESWFALADQKICTRNHDKIIYYPHKLMDELATNINSTIFNIKAIPKSTELFIDHKESIINKYNNLSADVIIPVYNALDDLIKCIESLKCHRKHCMYRCIIIDDASDIETKDYIIQLTQNEDWITSFRNEVSQGYGKAVNIGISLSNADFIVFLNSDTILTDGWIEKMADAVYSTKGAGIVGPISNAASYQSIPFTKGRNKQTAVNPIPKGLTPEILNSYLESWAEFGFYPRVPLVHGFCMGVTRSVINKIGSFDEIHFPKGYGEENDFCFRASNAGFSLVIAHNTYIFHAKSKSYTDDIRIPLMEEGSATLSSLYGKKRIQRAVDSMATNPLFLSIQTKAQYLYKSTYNKLKKVFIMRRKSLDELSDIQWWLRITPWFSDNFRNTANVYSQSNYKKLPDVNLPGVCVIHENVDDISDIDIQDWSEKWKSRGGKIVYDISINPFDIDKLMQLKKLTQIDATVLIKRLQWLIGISDVVTCPYKSLADLISKNLNINVVLLPYSFDKQMWHLDMKEAKTIAHNNDTKLHIGILDLTRNDFNYTELLNVAKYLEKKFKDKIHLNHIFIDSNCTIGQKKSLPKKQNYANFIPWLYQVINWDLVIIPRLISNAERELLFKICFSIGLCVIAEDGNDIPVFMKNNINCVLVNSSEYDEYVTSIQDLMANQIRRNELACNAKREALNFSSELQSEYLDRIISDLNS